MNKHVTNYGAIFLLSMRTSREVPFNPFDMVSYLNCSWVWPNTSHNIIIGEKFMCLGMFCLCYNPTKLVTRVQDWPKHPFQSQLSRENVPTIFFRHLTWMGIFLVPFLIGLGLGDSLLVTLFLFSLALSFSVINVFLCFCFFRFCSLFCWCYFASSNFYFLFIFSYTFSYLSKKKKYY